MAVIRLGDLTTFAGDPSGSFLVINDSTNTATYKIQREDLLGTQFDGTASYALTASYLEGPTSISGSLEVTGSITITDLLTLSTINLLPTSNVPSSSIMASGSGADLRPYFWNGATWTALF